MKPTIDTQKNVNFQVFLRRNVPKDLKENYFEMRLCNFNSVPASAPNKKVVKKRKMKQQRNNLHSNSYHRESNIPILPQQIGVNYQNTIPHEIPHNSTCLISPDVYCSAHTSPSSSLYSFTGNNPSLCCTETPSTALSTDLVHCFPSQVIDTSRILLELELEIERSHRLEQKTNMVFCEDVEFMDPTFTDLFESCQ